MVIYTVKPGDRLEQIAADFQVSAESIISANGLPNPAHLLAGQSLIILTAEPVIQRIPMEVNSYTYFLGVSGILPVMVHGHQLTSLTPFAYVVMENGSLLMIDDEPIIEAAVKEGCIPIMCIVNFSEAVSGQKLANILLNDDTAIRNLLNNVRYVMKLKGYKGLNIDFEYVQPGDRERYNDFLTLTVKLLHEEGYFVTTAVSPKTEAGQKGLLYEAVDYSVHGALMDYVILMTYEWGYRFGPPQAISPIDQIRRVLDYAVTAIPRDKIYFGFQIYARDWILPHVQGQEAETFSCQEALIRAVQFDVEIQYDTVAQSPFYRYRDDQEREHEVWFEDARSAQAKFDTVREYGLKGISYWTLGYPFPQNWTLLGENFLLTKYIKN
jgi:spore germination protein